MNIKYKNSLGGVGYPTIVKPEEYGPVVQKNHPAISYFMWGDQERMAGFVCKECGAMKNDYKYTMYKPKEGIKEFPPYCMPDEFRRFYTVYKHYPHKCDECGGDMKMLTVNAKPKCPRCGGMLGVGISNICRD